MFENYMKNVSFGFPVVRWKKAEKFPNYRSVNVLTFFQATQRAIRVPIFPSKTYGRYCTQCSKIPKNSRNILICNRGRI